MKKKRLPISRESRRRRSARSLASENFKRRPLIDRLRSMHSEPSAHLRKVRDKHATRSEETLSTSKRSFVTWRMPDKGSS